MYLNVCVCDEFLSCEKQQIARVNGGTVLISSWKCNYHIYMDIKVYYLDIQAISTVLCLYQFFMCNYYFYTIHAKPYHTIPTQPMVELVEYGLRSRRSHVQIPGLDSNFQNRNKFSITSGQARLGPMLCTGKWVKKWSPARLRWSLRLGHRTSTTVQKTTQKQKKHVI